MCWEVFIDWTPYPDPFFHHVNGHDVQRIRSRSTGFTFAKYVYEKV